MQFEKLKKNNHKKIIIGELILLGVLSTLILTTTRAKYRTTQSINILNGTITYKPYDLKVLAMYKQKEGSNCTEDNCYEEITGRMPSSGYVINESKSYCTLDGVNKDTEAVLKTINGEHVVRNLKKNEKCKLYFDKIKVTNIQELIAYSHINIGFPDFSKTATTDEGIFIASDGMYGGNSYYWRGAVENNHVIFAKMCWRIVRINGDGSIRLIYNGKVQDGNICFGNGANADSVIMGATNEEKFFATSDGQYANASYAGWTYTLNQQRPENNETATPSNAKLQTEKWYKTNITDKGYDGSVVTGKFCVDRNTGNPATDWSWPSGSYTTTWSANGTMFVYAAVDRLFNKYQPTLSCPSNDVYNLKVGAITADEVVMAGGKNENNQSYYLYNGQYYFSMSPNHWNNTYIGAYVFAVHSRGYLENANVNWTIVGLRPVINLRVDTQFQAGGNGTSTNPYVVQ